MFWEVSRYFYNGWIDDLYAKPSFHFKYPGFEWIVVPNDELLFLLFSLLGVLSIMIMVGLFYKLAATMFFLGVHLFLFDGCVLLFEPFVSCLPDQFPNNLDASQSILLFGFKVFTQIKSDAAPSGVYGFCVFRWGLYISMEESQRLNRIGLQENQWRYGCQIGATIQ